MDEDEVVEYHCPACGGVGNRLGHLGKLLWLRCRDCGIDFHAPEEETEDGS